MSVVDLTSECWFCHSVEVTRVFKFIYKTNEAMFYRGLCATCSPNSRHIHVILIDQARLEIIKHRL